MKTSSRSRATTVALTVLAPIAWGTTYVTITQLLPAGRPLLIASMRVVPAGLVLLAAGTISSRWRPRGIEWTRTITLAVFNFGLFFPLLAAAVYRLPGGIAAAVGGLQPLLVAGIAKLVTGRRPRRLDLVVGVIAAIGVGLVVIHPGAHLDPTGILCAAAANVSFSIGVVLTKRFPTPSNRLAATGWQLLLSGVLLVPLAAIIEGAPPALTGRNIAAFAYLSLIGTALAFVVWFNGIRRLASTAPPLLGLAGPVTGAILGWLILDQTLSPIQMVGFAITLSAIAYGARGSAADRRTDDHSGDPGVAHSSASPGVHPRMILLDGLEVERFPRGNSMVGCSFTRGITPASGSPSLPVPQEQLYGSDRPPSSETNSESTSVGS